MSKRRLSFILFVEKFWADDQIEDLIDLENNCQEDSLVNCNIDIKLYEKYNESFISEYSATNPGDDFAKILW